MALKATLKEVEFGIGDRVRVVQKIKDGEKFREASFEGMVIAINGRDPGNTFVVRRIAEAGIGVERIFPLFLPTIDKIVVVKRGLEGARRAKLYYTRFKAPTEVDLIFRRAHIKLNPAPALKKKASRARIKSASKKSK